MRKGSRSRIRNTAADEIIPAREYVSLSMGTSFHDRTVESRLDEKHLFWSAEMATDVIDFVCPR